MPPRKGTHCRRLQGAHRTITIHVTNTLGPGHEGTRRLYIVDGTLRRGIEDANNLILIIIGIICRRIKGTHRPDLIISILRGNIESIHKLILITGPIRRSIEGTRLPIIIADILFRDHGVIDKINHTTGTLRRATEGTHVTNHKINNHRHGQKGGHEHHRIAMTLRQNGQGAPNTIT